MNTDTKPADCTPGLRLRSTPGPAAAVPEEITFLKNYCYVVICLLGASQESLELFLNRTQRHKPRLPGRPCGFLPGRSSEPMGDGHAVGILESDF